MQAESGGHCSDWASWKSLVASGLPAGLEDLGQMFPFGMYLGIAVSNTSTEVEGHRGGVDETFLILVYSYFSP